MPNDSIRVLFQNYYESEEFQKMLFRYGFGWGSSGTETSPVSITFVILHIPSKQILASVSREDLLEDHSAHSAAMIIKKTCAPAFNCEDFFKSLRDY